MKKTALYAAVGLLTIFSIAGCNKAEEEQAESTAQNTGSAVEQGARNTGNAMEQGAKDAGSAVGSGVDAASGATQDAAKKLWTLKVKNALVADKQIAAKNLNVDTDTSNNMVIIKGTVASDALKKRVTQVAQKALTDMKAPAKIQNNVTVGK